MRSDDGSLSRIQPEVLGEASRLVLIDRARQAWETGWSLVVEAVKSHVTEWAANDDDFASLPAEIAALKSESARSSLVSDMRSEITKACEEFLRYYRQIERYCDDDFVRAWFEPWDYGLSTVTPTASDLLRDPTSFGVMLKASLKELTAESFGENVLFRMQYHAAEWRGRFDILKRVAENIATYHADFDKELFSLAGKLRGELPYEDCQAEVRVFIEKFAGGRDHPRWANAPPVELQFQCVDGSRGDEFTTFTLFNPFDRYDGPTELSQFWLQVVWNLSHLAYRGGTLHQQAKMRKQILEAARDYLDARGYQIPEATDKSEMGISLYDLAFVIEEDDSAATQRVKVWSDSKRISAESIGKCPLDGRRPLYRLSELLSDVKKLLSLNAKEVAKYRQALTAKLREPRPS